MLSIAASSRQLVAGLDLIRTAVADEAGGRKAVEISADQESVVLRAAGTTLSISTQIEAVIHEGGTAVVPLAPLRELLAAIPPQESVALLDQPDNPTLAVECASASARLWRFEAEVAPRWKAPTTCIGAFSEFDSHLIAIAAQSARADFQAPVLRGVSVSGGWAVATDKYRITRARLKLSGNLGTIPVSLAREWSRHAVSGPVYCDGATVRLDSDPTTWLGSLLPGQFPDVTSSFHEPAWSLDVDRAELGNVLRRVAVVGPRDSRAVHVNPGRGELMLWSDEPQVGRVDVPLAISGELTHPLCLHAAYLAQAVDGHPDEDTSLRISGGPGLAPVIISGSVVEHLVAQQRFTE